MSITNNTFEPVTDVYTGNSVDGVNKVFPISTTIPSESHVRVYFTYADEEGGVVIDHNITADKWDVVDNSIVFREPPNEDYTLKIVVSTTGEGLEVYPTVYSIVADNMEDINTLADISDDITEYTDRNLGPKSVVPITRNDGTPLKTGDNYYNTITNTSYIYTAVGTWQDSLRAQAVDTGTSLGFGIGFTVAKSGVEDMVIKSGLNGYSANNFEIVDGASLTIEDDATYTIM